MWELKCFCPPFCGFIGFLGGLNGVVRVGVGARQYSVFRCSSTVSHSPLTATV